MTARSIICYGKLPLQGDFVRVNANGDLIVAFDQWIQQSLMRDKQRLGSNGLDSIVSNGGVVRFIFCPQPGAVLTGVLSESRDSAGRKYPMVVAVEPTEILSDPIRVSDVSVELAGFHDYAAGQLSGILSGVTPVDQLQTDLNNAPVESRPRVSSRLAELVTGLWGQFDSLSKYVTFGSLFRVLSPLRGRMPPRLSFGIRFPIRSDAALGARDVAFWLKISAALTGDTEFQPVCFWQSEVDSSKSWLLVFLRPGPPLALSSLFRGGEGDDDVFDLETSMGDSAADLRQAIPPEFGRLLEEEDLRLETIDSRMRAISYMG